MCLAPLACPALRRVLSWPAICVWAWAWSLLLLPGASQADTLQLTRALAVVSDGDRFPDASSGSIVDLPDEWRNAKIHQEGPVWYRMAFDRPAPGSARQPLALYIDRACSNLQVDFNGERLYGHGRMEDPIRRGCRESHLIPLPQHLLKVRDNVLDIKLAGYPLANVASRTRAAGLSVLEIGSLDELAERQDATFRWRVLVPTAATSALMLLGALVLLVAWQRRREPHLAWFGALCLVWAATLARLWLARTELPNQVAEMLISSSVPLAVLCAVQFLLTHAHSRQRAVDVALWVQCLMLPISLLLSGPDRVFMISSSWYLLLMIEMLLALAWYLLLTWRQRREAFAGIAVVLAVTMAGATLMLLQQQGVLSEVQANAAQLASPLVLMAIGARLILEQMMTLRTAESQRDALERRIYETAGEAERNYAQMVEIRVEQVTQQERKRIAADLHDDLGAKLLTIVHTSDNERISTLAREALEEMRLSVRGLTGKPVRLIDALGDWRAEVVARLSQASVEGEWTAPQDDVPQTLSARAYVQTTRILREAVSNIIKHSGASICKITCKIIDGDFKLTIQDNGNGIPMELDGRLDRGHGMSSMKHRAKQIHGQCLVESGPGYGTVIRLTLPLGA